MTRCVDLNLKVLEKLKSLLGTIEDSAYQKQHQPFMGSSIGGHVRHIIDFYQIYLQGAEVGTINFTERKRDNRLENDPRLALDAIVEIETTIQSQLILLGDGNLSVISDSGDTFNSSRGRELEFLAGHAVHHNAMIVAMCDSMDVPVQTEMALAESTKEFQTA